MKKIVFAGVGLIVLIILSSFFKAKVQASLTGAWSAISGNNDHILIFQDGYFSYTIFDEANKKFKHTSGGTFSEMAGRLHVNMEFDEDSKENVGSHKHFSIAVGSNKLTLDLGGGVSEWIRTDDGTTGLAGNWRISGRMNNGGMQPVQKSARKTLKLLSAHTVSVDGYQHRNKRIFWNWWRHLYIQRW